MEVNSIKKVLKLINNLNIEDYKLNFKVRKIDYCYELTVDDYTIYFEDTPYKKDKYLEISYKLNESIDIRLSKKEIEYFEIIFKLLLTNYLRNCKLQDVLHSDNRS